MKTFLAALLSIIWMEMSSQNIGINDSGATPDASAILDLDDTTKGFLPPRHTTVQRDLILNPAIGLQIYNLDTKCLDIFDGISWRSYCPTSTADPCPTGFVQVPGAKFKIEVVQRSQMTWFMADSICMSIGTRLCTYGEWYYSCLHQANTIPPLQTMVGNNEWLDDTGDSDMIAVVGLNNCEDRERIDPTVASPRFRCCCGCY